MITSEQVDRFVEAGAVTIDTPLTKGQIDAAAQALDHLLPQTEGRWRASATCNYEEAAILELLQHPFFEQVACRVLNAPAVHFLQTAILKTWPQPDVEFSFDQHIDMQYTLSDFEATPRRVVCHFFLWLTDVTDRRSPMMFRPGSHRPLAAHWESQPDLCPLIPRVIGVKLADLPDLDYAEPEPVTANAGQVSVLTTGMVHGASVNVDDSPRKALVMSFHDTGVRIGLPEAQEQTKRDYDRLLRERFRPDRAHLVRPEPV